MAQAAIAVALATALVLSAAAQQSDNRTIITAGPEAKSDLDIATFAFAATEPTSRFACSIDGGTPRQCASPMTYGNLSDGRHRFVVQAFDGDGTPLAAAERSWSINTSATTRIVSGPSGPVETATVAFEFVSKYADARFVCSLDGQPFTACTSPHTYTELRNGSHAFAVASIDALGQHDPQPARRKFQVAVDRFDLCPGTPAGAAELSEGCAASELVRNPEVLIAPALQRIRDAQPRLVHEAYRDAAAALTQADLLIRAAGEQLADAAVCEATTTFKQASGELHRADREMAAAVRARQAALPADPPGAIDATDSNIASARFHLHERLLAADTAAVRATETVFERLCASAAGPVSMRGQVTATDDATRTVRLDTGMSVPLARQAMKKTLVAGVPVAIEGIRFHDGTVVATQVVTADPSGIPGGVQCMALRIAPVQRLAPNSPGPFVVHPPEGYRNSGNTLELERRMGLAAAETGCPGMAADGWALSYSARIDLESFGGNDADTLATDLRDGEAPVRLPWFASDQAAVIIKMTVHRTRCHPTIPLSCGVPEVIQSDTYSATVKETGSYATVTYDRTVFAVKDNGVAGDFESARATGFQLGITGHAFASFTAEGYGVQGQASTRPAVAAIGLNQPFAVYEDDFVNPEVVMPSSYISIIGHFSPSALRWARVAGLRNGAPFSYAARLPRLLRDAIDNAPPSPSFILPPSTEVCGDNADPAPPGQQPFTVMGVEHTFYKHPFSFGFRPGHGNMNIDDPAECRRHGELQAYALDLTATLGMTLRAARGGVVATVAESEPDITKPCGGNYMWIRHDDGTFAIYFHMLENGVDVVEGQRVKRGQLVARVGTTGCSSGPHVHFGVHAIEGTEFGKIADGNSLRVRYQVLVEEIDAVVSPMFLIAGAGWSSSNFAPN